jgi:hypothetical protein
MAPQIPLPSVNAPPPNSAGIVLRSLLTQPHKKAALLRGTLETLHCDFSDAVFLVRAESRLVLLNPSVFNLDDPVPVLSVPFVVSHLHNRRPFPVQLLKKLHDLLPLARV